MLSQATMEKTVFAAAGNSFQTPLVQMDFTFGEPVTKDPMNGTVLLTQGFHQPEKKKHTLIPMSPISTAALGENEAPLWAVYPNPFIEVIIIETTYFEKAHLYDVSGRLIFEIPLETALTELSTLQLSTGNYLVRLSKDNEFKLIELVKTHN
jgi:hypothetical protein